MRSPVQSRVPLLRKSVSVFLEHSFFLYIQIVFLGCFFVLGGYCTGYTEVNRFCWESITLGVCFSLGCVGIACNKAGKVLDARSFIIEVNTALRASFRRLFR